MKDLGSCTLCWFCPNFWPHLGGAQPCALAVVVCHMVPQTTDSRTGSSLEAAPGPATGKQRFGDRAVGTHSQMFHLLLRLMVLIHREGRPTGKSSETAFAHTWLQLGILGIVLFSSFFLIKQKNLLQW